MCPIIINMGPLLSDTIKPHHDNIALVNWLVAYALFVGGQQNMEMLNLLKFCWSTQNKKWKSIFLISSLVGLLINKFL